MTASHENHDLQPSRCPSSFPHNSPSVDVDDSEPLHDSKNDYDNSPFLALRRPRAIFNKKKRKKKTQAQGLQKESFPLKGVAKQRMDMRPGELILLNDGKFMTPGKLLHPKKMEGVFIQSRYICPIW